METITKTEEKILPNFIVVGAAKSGTTSIYQYLKQHSQVYMSPVKETHFFSSDIDPKKFRPDYAQALNKDLTAYVNGPMDKEIFHAFVTDWEIYKKLFKNATGKKAIGEVTNSYLFSTSAAANIKQYLPQTKVIMILRNPIERIFSHYLMDIRSGVEKLPFKEAVIKDMNKNPKGWGISNVYVEIGMYSQQVKRFMEQFPKEQLMIILFDDFKKDAAGVMKNIFSFIGIDTETNIDFSVRYNKAFIPKSKWVGKINSQRKLKLFLKDLMPKSMKSLFKKAMFTDKNLPVMSADEKQFLVDLYKEDISQLGKLLNRDLSNWIK